MILRLESLRPRRTLAVLDAFAYRLPREHQRFTDPVQALAVMMGGPRVPAVRATGLMCPVSPRAAALVAASETVAAVVVVAFPHALLGLTAVAFHVLTLQII